MAIRLKISPHHHSGRLRPHEHTSYMPLFGLLTFVGVILMACTVTAATPYAGPEAGSIGLRGAVPGKPPKAGATITSPVTGSRTSTSPMTVKGTCPPKLLVEVFKNDIFAGSTPCTDAGTFSLDVDLLFGENRLVARVYDDLNQPGPDSATVTVFYDALPPQGSGLANLSFGGAQMLLNTDAVFRGSFPGEEMLVPLTIIGGTPPYAVNVQWGDASNKVVPRNDNLTFNVGHIYKKAGVYQLTFQATDSQGRVAFLTVAGIINGQPAPAAVAEAKNNTTNKLMWLWPLFAIALAIAISFWLGERREKRVLERAGLLVTP